jgi:hypothetical protein
MIGNKVIVPQRLFKIIMLPEQKKTLVLIVNNNNNKDINITTLSELEKLIPVKF